MSWMDRLEPPESDFSDEEWDTARAQLVQERIDLGWTCEDADAHVDDLMIEEQCVQNRDDRASVWADEEHARRKESL